MSNSQSADTALVPTASSVLMHIVKSIVDTPDAVKVETVEDEGKIILEVRVADGDLGRVDRKSTRLNSSHRT